jgi:beta-glucanase (GH16 family)
MKAALHADAVHRVLARGAVTLLVLALGGGVLAASAHSDATAPAQTTTVVKRVPRGVYAVVVSLAAPEAAESVNLTVGAQTDTDIALAPGAGAILAFKVDVRRNHFDVRTVSTGATPAYFSVADALQRPQTIPAIPAGSTLATGSSSPAGATGATGSTGAPAAGAVFVAPTAKPYKHLVWSDEFNGPASSAPNPANWGEDTYGGCGDDTLSNNTQSTANASLDGNGDLAITADGGPSYDSAQLDSGGHVSFEYGELEARIRIPSGSGLCSAFWLLGDSTTATGSCWPQCGEIDVMEAISLYPDDVFATLHGPVSGSGNFQQWQAELGSATAFTDEFHTYGIIWTPNSLTWTFDGVPYATATPAQLPASAQWVFEGHPFHIMFDLAVGGWPGAPAVGAPFPATMSVDWVRLYD